jgi:adenosylmethionine-8-amino-7-oxononanoate aminotransferase
VRRGVLLRPLGDVVVLMPPLTITSDEIDRIVSTLAEAVAEVAAEDPGPDLLADEARGPRR